MTSETPFLKLTSAGCERFLGPNRLPDLSLAPSTQRHAWLEAKATEQAWFSEGVQHSHSELRREAFYGLTVSLYSQASGQVCWAPLLVLVLNKGKGSHIKLA